MTKEEKLERQLAKERERAAKQQMKKKTPKVKPQKIKKSSGAGGKFLAVVLWILLIGVFAYGVFAIVNREDTQSIKKEMGEYYSELSEGQNLSGFVSSFAENFVTDYYTNNEKDDYQKRIAKYTANGLNIENPIGVSSVLSTKALRTKIDGKDIEVEVRTQVDYKIVNEDGKERSNVKTFDVAVPIKVEDGNYAVCSLPHIVAFGNDPSKIDANGAVTDEDEDTDWYKQCKTLSINFLSAYCGSKPSELKYFVTKEYGTVATLGNDMSFKEMSACEVEKSGDKYTARCVYVISNSGVEEVQQITLTIVEGAEGRYYVESTSAI